MIDFQGAVPKILQITNPLILMSKNKGEYIIEPYLFITNYNTIYILLFILFLKEDKEGACLASSRLSSCQVFVPRNANTFCQLLFLMKGTSKSVSVFRRLVLLWPESLINKTSVRGIQISSLCHSQFHTQIISENR